MSLVFLSLIVACYFDYRQGRIPNPLIVLLCVFGAVLGGVSGGFLSVLKFCGIAAGLTLALYPFFAIGALGAGDVKLLAVCGGFFPTDKILFFLFYSMLIAVVFSIIKIAGRIRNGETVQDCRRTRLCLSGPVLCSVLLYLGGIY